MSEGMQSSADVVVIGGGISGCAIAYNLARRGRKVVLLEKDDIAYEASGKTMAAVGLLGKQKGEYELAKESLDLYRQLNAELGTDIEFIEGGRLLTAESPEDMPLLEEMVEGARGAGVEVDVLEEKVVRTRFPYVEGPFEAIAFSPHEGHVNPINVVRAFARAAQEQGAKFHTGCLATNIEVKRGRVSSVRTSIGEIETDVVVNAAGVWAYRLMDRLGAHLPIQIIRQVQGETEPLDTTIPAYIRAGLYGWRQTATGAIRITNGYRDQAVYHDLSVHDLRDIRVWLPRLMLQRKYVSFRIDRDLLRHEIRAFLASLRGRGHRFSAPVGLEAKSARKRVLKQLRQATRLVPLLKEVPLETHWGGFIDLTPDVLPVLGESGRPEGLYLAMGFSGHGFALGPLTGKLIAELIIDGKASLPLDPFRVSRFAEGKVTMPRRLI